VGIAQQYDAGLAISQTWAHTLVVTTSDRPVQKLYCSFDCRRRWVMLEVMQSRLLEVETIS